MTAQRDFTFYFLMAFSSLPLISVLLPRFMTFLPSTLGLAAYLYLTFYQKKAPALSRHYVLISLAIGGLCAFSAISSVHPGEVLQKAGLTTLLLLSAVFLIAVCRSLEPGRLKAYAWVFPALLVAAALLGAFELFFNMPLYPLFHDAAEGRKISTAEVNRGAVNIVLCSFAALSLLKVWNAPSSRLRLYLGALLICSILAMLTLSQAQVAQLAFVLGLGIYLLYPSGWKPGYRIFSVLVCLLMLAAPWLAQWMFATLAVDAQNLSWLQSGYAGARMEIWDFTSRHALESPWTGHGMDAIRSVESFEHARLYHKEDSVLHPHNFAIQLWVDFGLIGVVCGCALLVYLLQQIALLGKDAALPAFTTFFLTLLVAAISYGLWQSHWIGVMVYLIALQQFFGAFRPDLSAVHNIRQV